MKMFVAFLALAFVAVSFAAPQGHPEIQLVKETPVDNIGVGGYNYGYELSNGESKQETAQLKTVGTENVVVVSGSFSWVDPATNQRYTINYIADENGFQAQGDHIPKAV